MSWDCYMEIDTGGKEPATVADVRNVTYNNSKIFSLLGVHPDELRGKIGRIAEPLVRKALALSYEIEAEIKPLEPSNNWGGVDDVRDFLQKLLMACQAHPKATVRII